MVLQSAFFRLLCLSPSAFVLMLGAVCFVPAVLWFWNIGGFLLSLGGGFLSPAVIVLNCTLFPPCEFSAPCANLA